MSGLENINENYKEDKNYLETKVRPILERLIQSTVNENPQNPVNFMIQYLENYMGIDPQKDEKDFEELQSLRTKIAYYKNKLRSVDYIESEEDSDENQNSEEQKKFEEELEKRKKGKKAERAGISAEVYGENNKKAAFVPKVVPKTEAQKEKIKNKMMTNFMFNCLDPKEMNTVIDAFEEVRKNPKDVIIKEGDNGNVLYLIEEGNLDCFKIINGENKLVKKYSPGESFGELALLYNAPRAASIIAKTKCLLWSLDRECFNNIVKTSAIKKREKYEEALKKVEILKSISNYEITQICDALKQEFYKAGNKIINEGDKGNTFYILMEGKAYASKKLNGEEKVVLDYEPGNYFGELALVRNDCRAASVFAKTDCTVLSLDRGSFKRLLGPIEDILKRNSENYVKFINK